MEANLIFEQKFYSVAETANLLRCSPWSVRTWLRLGRLKAVKVGGRVLVSRESLKRIT